MIARIPITSFALFSVLAILACGDDSGKDGTMTRTDAVSIGNAPPPPPSPGFAGGSASEGDMAARREMSAPAMAPDQQTAQDPLQGIGQFNTGATSMLIRTGQAFIEVEQLDPAILKVRQLAAQVGGFIANSSITGGRDQIRQATFELKIPAGKYDETVGSLDRIGKVETVSSSAQDVGEEFVDITARVANARRLEDRLLSLLANRTGKLDEVLRVERELARIREEIERYEGRLRYLSSRVATSTLTITIHEPGPLLGSNPGENPIGAALRRAWRNFVGLIAGVIASLGILIPLGALAFVGWVGYRRWRKNRTA
ncbi:MAG TPA: DUF4349 domain-containing protein [Gemmatimonadaceae bacterium]|nr:DUF4349 domain-containing protein [Gemmatimonadaceae bacterium]